MSLRTNTHLFMKAKCMYVASLFRFLLVHWNSYIFFIISTAICLWLSLWYEESYKYQNLFHSLSCGGNFCLFLVGNMREEVTENRQEGDQKMLSFWWCHFWMALSLWPLSWRRSLSYRKQSVDWFLYDRDRRHERLNW